MQASSSSLVDLRAVLAEVPLFAGLDEEELGALSALADRQDLRSGARLYKEGDPSTHGYVVVRGRLRETSDGELLGYIGRLEPVGEIGIQMDEPRSSTIRAVRDSILLRFDKEDLLGFLDHHPAVQRALSRLMIVRLREQGRVRVQGATEVHGTLAVIPASPDLPVMALAEALVRRLSGWPDARLITAAHVDATLGQGAAQAPLSDDEGSTRLAAWMNELESRHRYVVYAADSDRDAWALRSLHNADRVLVLTEASARPRPVRVLQELRSLGLLAPVELVFLRPVGDSAPHTSAWMDVTGARARYFVHPWDEAELASLARQVAGHGVGVVLGGGGARGFAHIGLIRALEELRVPVDVAGGTSMGAFLSALLALGLDSVEMVHVARETFIRNNFLNDYALPRVSLIRGRKFSARLAEIFGDRQIEELRRTFFCVSTNLTTGAPVVHDRGPLSVWVGTSMAVPGIAPPVAYEGELLCDGGVLDNLPTGVMQRLERGAIIASNVSTDGYLRAPGSGVGAPDPEALLRHGSMDAPPRISEILVRSAMLSSATSVDLAAERADVYVRMPSQEFGIFDWKRLDDLVELGYRHALERLAPVRDTLVS
ncbi:MAG TPA: patatin-like phospholipase family protein [Acidimicrobiales bacterium]|nr:patatin-like phospholipase family protein [Acidimicrobiales bacterium]